MPEQRFDEITAIYDAAVQGAQTVIADHQREIARRVIGRVFSFYAPPPDISTADWADKHVILPRSMTARPGRWVTDRRPFLRGIMDAFDNPLAEIIDVEKASRMGITTIINNYVGRRQHLDPCAIMYAQQTLGMAKVYNSKVWTPFVTATPVLHTIFIEEKSRDAGSSTIYEKRTSTGGTYSLTGGNVPTGFRMVFQEVVIGDDLDGWSWTVGKEGDPVKNMTGRTRDVWNRKIILVSKPTIKGFSRIHQSFEQSDQRYYHVPCPHCDHGQPLRWGGGKDLPYGIKWTGDDPYSAYYLCEQCSGVIRDHHKDDILAAGMWVPTATPKDARHWGFGGLSQLYHPDISFAEIVKEYLACGDNPEQLQVFYNDNIGECWEDKGEGLSEGGLFERREDWVPGELPEGVAVLTGSADVGDNHIACSIEGWGAGMENWVIDYQLYEGDTLQAEIWEDLRKYVMLAWKHYCGIMLRPIVFVVDAGYRTEMVAAFIKTMKTCGVNVIAIVGREHTRTNEIISGNVPSKKGKHKMSVYTINDDRAKVSVLSRLRVPKPGGGYVHFPKADWCNEDYFNQLLSEKKIRARQAGVLVEKWIRKPGVRNEPFDCKKYSLSGLIWQQKHKWTKHVIVNGKPMDPLDAAAYSMAMRVEIEKAKRIERGELPANEYFMQRAKATMEKVKQQEQRKVIKQPKKNFATGWRR